MPHGFQGVVLRALGAKEHLITVRDTTYLAPHFLRLSFDAGPTLLSQVTPGPAAWLRLWLPDPASGVEYQRAYTIAGLDAVERRLDVDFLLHEPAGPGAAWAREAVPGQTVVAQSLGSTIYRPLKGARGLLVIGDAASIPAVNAILRSTPPDVEVRVLLERSREEDELIPLAHHPRAGLRWVARTGPDSLAAEVAGGDLGGFQVWAAGETGSLKGLRPVLRDRLGASRRTAHVQAYWIEGRAMGTARKSA